MSSFEHSGDPAESEGAAEQLYRIRHSLAHVMAQAVLEMRPGSTLGFGPPVRDGFYYDFILSEPLTEEDFPELERRMKKILKKGDKYMKKIAKTASKKLPKVDKTVKHVKVSEDARQLELHDPVSEEDVLDDLEDLLEDG